MLHKALYLLLFISNTAFAAQCNLQSVSTVDIKAEKQSVILDEENKVQSILKTPSQRCASVQFTISGSGSRLISTIRDSFTAVLYDGEEITAQSLKMKDNQTDRISFGKRYKHEGFVCFGEQQVPISEIRCEL
ncbi:hypothetical protein [Photobacterium alginatilyticum]|uniref:DUF2541 domain-containing protein n=1 Tax=Photobacterium alginatilyticum TaxID=1775171 RepID=A0ABW9YKL2_9GAMM|nr:hypothetical protein [Photobacterium alginatilyticum]NBI54255.1 hypothetical protein [Photobacterium alginatilyticum]